MTGVLWFSFGNAVCSPKNFISGLKIPFPVWKFRFRPWNFFFDYIYSQKSMRKSLRECFLCNHLCCYLAYLWKGSSRPESNLHRPFNFMMSNTTQACWHDWKLYMPLAELIERVWILKLNEHSQNICWILELANLSSNIDSENSTSSSSLSIFPSQQPRHRQFADCIKKTRTIYSSILEFFASDF